MNNIRKYRKQKGLTMKELGKIVGVAESTISLYETSKHDPDIATLRRIANTLEVSLDDLVGHTTSTQLEDEAMAIRERLRRDPSYRLLFDAADGASPEHLRAAAAMLKALDPDKPDYFADDETSD